MRAKSGFCKWKGKAAETRHLAPYATHLAERFMDGSTHAARRLAVCQLLQRFYELLAIPGLRLPPTTIAEMQGLGKNSSHCTMR